MTDRRLYLDIETLPTNSNAVISSIAANVRPPANYKVAETIAKWEAETKPQAVAEEVHRTGLSGAFGRICVICWAWNDDPVQNFYRDPLNQDAERGLLEDFFGRMKVEGENYDQKIVIGHNILSFDLRFLWQRAFVLGVRVPNWFPRNPKPWSRDVFDTMAQWAGDRDRISLGNLCEAFGLEGKNGMTGADVAATWAAGEHQKVVDYCIEDVSRVRQIHKRMAVALNLYLAA
jgi:hypothetical protein